MMEECEKRNQVLVQYSTNARIRDSLSLLHVANNKSVENYTWLSKKRQRVQYTRTSHRALSLLKVPAAERLREYLYEVPSSDSTSGLGRLTLPAAEQAGNGIRCKRLDLTGRDDW